MADMLEDEDIKRQRDRDGDRDADVVEFNGHMAKMDGSLAVCAEQACCLRRDPQLIDWLIDCLLLFVCLFHRWVG
jgi:hypothetical protein